MPLSAPIERQPLHIRRVVCSGFFRADGLWDIEGRITDEKTYDHENEFRGALAPGDFVHNMWIRLTVDRALTIVAAEAATDSSPYRVCGAIAPDFRKLVGLRIAGGFHREVKARLGGVHGCTHIVELLGPVATTAFQTVSSDRSRAMRREWEAAEAARRGEPWPKPRPPADPNRPKRPPNVLNTCHAWAADGEVVRRWAPDFYTGPDAEAARAEAAGRPQREY